MRTFMIGVMSLALAACGEPAARDTAPGADGVYQTGPASRDGIGKFYMGREISQVMGHLGAGWLERADREAEERTDLLVANLDVEPTDVIADIGAGTGYFAFRLAPLVPQGKVLAVDIQQEMLDIIARRKGDGWRNIDTVLGTVTDPNLPQGTDALILPGTDVGLTPPEPHLPAGTGDLSRRVDAYHEFSYPREMGEAMVRALRPGGRIALVEYRAEDPFVPIKPLHKMSEDQAKNEMAALGLEWIETKTVLPQQHLMLFAKPQP